jgi:hypothetical protein
MSEVAELSATEAAQRLLPLLKEYSGKVNALSERAAAVVEKLVAKSALTEPAALEAARLVCLYDTLERQLLELARETSGLVEHAAFEHYLRLELKLRLDELEEHIKFCGVMIGELLPHITVKGRVERLRSHVEKTRLKAPF